MGNAKRLGSTLGALWLALVGIPGCTTVDLGDNFVTPNVQLDEDFFFCRIQPEVLTAKRCASGESDEAGSCHSSRSALRLAMDAEDDEPPTCDADGRVTGTVPASYEMNLSAVRFTILSDPTASPLYRRPTGLDSHPRTIFEEGSPEADLLVEWIAGGGL
jgi:hypothetical protein